MSVSRRFVRSKRTEARASSRGVGAAATARRAAAIRAAPPLRTTGRCGTCVASSCGERPWRWALARSHELMPCTSPSFVAPSHWRRTRGGSCCICFTRRFAHRSLAAMTRLCATVETASTTAIRCSGPGGAVSIRSSAYSASRVTSPPRSSACRRTRPACVVRYVQVRVARAPGSSVPGNGAPLVRTSATSPGSEAKTPGTTRRPPAVAVIPVSGAFPVFSAATTTSRTSDPGSSVAVSVTDSSGRGTPSRSVCGFSGSPRCPRTSTHCPLLETSTASVTSQPEPGGSSVSSETSVPSGRQSSPSSTVLPSCWWRREPTISPPDAIATGAVDPGGAPAGAASSVIVPSGRRSAGGPCPPPGRRRRPTTSSSGPSAWWEAGTTSIGVTDDPPVQRKGPLAPTPRT